MLQYLLPLMSRLKQALKGGPVNDERVRRESRLFKAQGVNFMVMSKEHPISYCCVPETWKLGDVHCAQCDLDKFNAAEEELARSLPTLLKLLLS